MATGSPSPISIGSADLLLQIVAVGVGGSLGAIARFGVGLAVRSTPLPPYAGTLAVNLLGCYGIGVAFIALHGAHTPPWLRAMLITGVLGAFTTFSTFSLESMQLVERRAWGHLTANVSLSVLAGFAAVHLGLLSAHWMGLGAAGDGALTATAPEATETLPVPTSPSATDRDTP